MRERALHSYRLLVSVARWRALAAPLECSRRGAGVIFLASFAMYLVIGQLINGFHGHDVYNWFFNADPPRIVKDVARAHIEWPSINTSAAHPFLVVLLNPIGALLSRLLCDSALLATLLMCHAAAALANVFVFLILLEVGAQKRIAVAGTLVHALSTTQMMLGSLPETASFSSAAVTASIWISLRHARPLANVVAHTLTFAMNGAMLPHALLAAPVLWLGRLPLRRYATRVLQVWAGMVALVVVLFLLQRSYYAGISLLGGDGYNAYDRYTEIPATAARFFFRAGRVLPHIFAFAVAAPVPLLSAPPERITTFMVDQSRSLARYDALGVLTITCWALLFAVACRGHWRALFAGKDGDPRTRNLALLVVGWLAGAFALFMCFGDDLLLFSFFWISHLVLFVASGVGRALEGDPRLRRWVPALLGVFLLLLAANQVVFIGRVLRHYTDRIFTL